MIIPGAVGSRIFNIDLSGRTISSFVLAADAPFLAFGAAGSIYDATSTGIFEYYDTNVDRTVPILDEWLTANDLHLSWPAADASTLQHRSGFGPDTVWMDYPVSPGIDGLLHVENPDRRQIAVLQTSSLSESFYFKLTAGTGYLRESPVQLRGI